MPRGLAAHSRHTPRLELRPFRRRDLDALIEAVLESKPQLEPWLPWAHEPYRRSDALRFIRESGAAWAESRAFDMTIRALDDPGRHLGNISVWHTSRRERSGEIGYWIRTSATRSGVATEAGARMVQTVFEELRLHRVTLRIAVGNRASERVAEKLGFIQEGVLRREVLVRGEWVDHSLWALLDEEYATEKERYVKEGWILE
jgi:RimJ/RimL family protein N-acetyltransferase